jgi:hypothetical protein
VPGRRHETATVPLAVAAMLATFACSADCATASLPKPKTVKRANAGASGRIDSNLAHSAEWTCGKNQQQGHRWAGKGAFKNSCNHVVFLLLVFVLFAFT